MRLLSFVPCGCRAGPIDDAPPADHAGDAAAAARRRRRRRRAAAGSVGGAAAAQWRPSLGDIYEEYSTDAAKTAAGPARARKAASWDVARVLPRAHSDEYRYLHVSHHISLSLSHLPCQLCEPDVLYRSSMCRHLESASSMPAFAPTAYLF
jgi:hypothetical protein